MGKLTKSIYSITIVSLLASNWTQTTISYVTMGGSALIMAALIGLSLTPAADGVFRMLNGLRSPIRQEEERLRPLFNEVAATAGLDG